MASTMEESIRLVQEPLGIKVVKTKKISRAAEIYEKLGQEWK